MTATSTYKSAAIAQTSVSSSSTHSQGEISGIRRSYVEGRREPAGISGSTRPISFGDKLFARLMIGGRTVVEFMINSVNDLTELLGELRRRSRGVKGLAKLYLRNMSRGWSCERPLMLYPSSFKTQPTRASISTTPDSYFRNPTRQLSFPWEL